jgi:ABC-type transport system substrate-binding protein
MNRRVALILVTVLIAAIVPAGLHAGPAAGNVLRLSINGDVAINPITFPQQLPTTQVIKVLFNTLTKFNPGDLKVVQPGDVVDPGKDGRIWVFKLRRGVKWRRPAVQRGRCEGHVRRDPGSDRALYRTVSRPAVGAGHRDYTVRFEFDRPYPSLPIVVGQHSDRPQAPAGGRTSPNARFIRSPVGTVLQVEGVR